MAFGFGLNANRAEATGTAGVRRLVTNGVLSADVVRDGTADFIHFIQRLRKERDAARTLRNDLQCSFGPLGMLFIP